MSGLKDTSNYFKEAAEELVENVCLVTFGHETKIQVRFTSTYDAIERKIGICIRQLSVVCHFQLIYSLGNNLVYHKNNIPAKFDFVSIIKVCIKEAKRQIKNIQRNKTPHKMKQSHSCKSLKTKEPRLLVPGTYKLHERCV